MGIHFSHVLEIVSITASGEIVQKHLPLECSVFPYFYILSEITFPIFGDNTTDVRTNKKKLFPIPFSLELLRETLH